MPDLGASLRKVELFPNFPFPVSTGTTEMPPGINKYPTEGSSPLIENHWFRTIGKKLNFSSTFPCCYLPLSLAMPCLSWSEGLCAHFPLAESWRSLPRLPSLLRRLFRYTYQWFFLVITRPRSVLCTQGSVLLGRPCLPLFRDLAVSEFRSFYSSFLHFFSSWKILFKSVRVRQTPMISLICGI